MNKAFLRSLRARLIIGAAIWIAIGVYAAGIFIAALFRQLATDLVDAELRKHLEELVTLIDVDADGFPHLYRPLSDPLFSQIGSGFSWQVSQSGRSLIKSTSASTDELPVPDDVLGAERDPQVHCRRAARADDRSGTHVSAGGRRSPPLRIQIGAETAVIDQMLPTFDIPLSVSLALLALALIAAAALQVSFGLQPMSRLRRALGAIGSGKAASCRRLSLRSATPRRRSQQSDRDQRPDGAARAGPGRQSRACAQDAARGSHRRGLKT